MSIVIGTAGWSIPATAASAFPAQGTSLERYATRFAGAEINSSFHRSHRASTWQRWADSVPGGFRFSAKLPKAITHQHRLAGCGELLARFVDEVAPLGPKLAVLLVQLPPSLAFDAALVEPFLDRLAALTDRRVACEPRHPSWFEDAPDALLAARGVARVAADPARVPRAAEAGGWAGLRYYRLHGSPVMYRSAYDRAALAGYAAAIRRGLLAGAECWCMFDNTASSAAAGDALALSALLAPPD